MSRVYDLSGGRGDRGEYQRQVDGLIKYLNETAGEVFDRAVYLALEGTWREWSDDQAAGSEVRFTAEMLRECGDSNVAALAGLICAIELCLETLKRGRDGPQPSQPIND